MEIYQLKQRLQSNTPYIPVLVFAGPEVGIMDIFIQQVAQVNNNVIQRPHSVADAIQAAGNKSIISAPVCYVIRQDDQFMRTESAWSKLLEWAQHSGGAKIILVYNNLDQRGKFYKQFQDIVVMFDKLAPEVLLKYAQKNVALSDDHALQLIARSGGDYARLLLELNKFEHILRIEGVDPTDKDDVSKLYKYCVEAGVFTESPKDQIFDLVEAFTLRQARQILQMQKDYEELNSSPLGFITLLYLQMRNMLMIKGAMSNTENKDIAQQTGLEPWKIMKIKQSGTLSKWSIPELVRALKVLRHVESGIKMGKIDSLLAFDYLIVTLL